MNIPNPIKAWKDRRSLKKHGVYPPKPIKTNGISTFWYAHGCPKKLGALITVDMTSGKQAIFRLSEIDNNANDVDWSWYTFEFVRYVEEDRP